MTEIQEHSDKQLKYADKIAKMLALAENAGTQAEAEAFTEKAQSLMTEYAISNDLLAIARGDQLQDEIVRDRIDYVSIYRIAEWYIGNAVAEANHCKVLISKNPWDAEKPKSTYRLILIGFKSDVERVKLLNASLQIQASIAMRRWWAEKRDEVEHRSGMQQFKMRRTFLSGFASGVQTKLMHAMREGVSAAERGTGSRVGSGELVLVAKKERIQTWVDETYGRKMRSVKMSYKDGGMDARLAGNAAGRQANVGTKGLGRTTRGELS